MVRFTYLKEIIELACGLRMRDIPFEVVKIFDGVQIRCADWDAVCHSSSYGHIDGLLEIYGSLVDEEKDGDTVAGWLTAEEVLMRVDGVR